MQLSQKAWRGPTPEEYLTVKAVQKATGILTVKDAETGADFKGAAPYGQEYQRAPNKVEGVVAPGTNGMSQNTFLVRTVEVRLIGTKRLPKGIVIGGNEVWVRDIPLEYGGTDFSCTDFRRDICTEEFNRLTAWANEQVWVTDEMIEKSDREAAARRQGMLATQQDPIKAAMDAIGPAIVSAIQSAGSRSPSQEQLAKFGLRWDEKTNTIVPIARETVGAAK